MKRILSIILGLIFSTSLYAFNGLPDTVGLTLGYSLKLNKQAAQDVVLSPALTNRYDAASTDSGMGLIGINFAYQLPQLLPAVKAMRWFVGAGLYKNDFTYKGDETPAINYGGGDKLEYSYKDKSFALLAEAKVIYQIKQWQPYALIGVGFAQNALSNYNEKPIDPAGSAVAIPSYENHSTMKMAYEIALGVQRVVDKHFVLGVDLRQLSFGSGYLKAPKGQYYSQSAQLKANNLGLLGIALNAAYHF